jgi:hypothetical protein
MRHFLVGVAAVIGEQAIARFGQALLAGDPAVGAQQRRDLGIRRLRGEIVG